MRYNIQAKEGLTMSAICCQKNLKRAAGMLYLGRGFIGVIPSLKLACFLPVVWNQSLIRLPFTPAEHLYTLLPIK